MADRTVVLEFQLDVDESVESINKLVAANKRLRQERNELNLKTTEGKQRAAELNSQIDKNTEVIKANSSALEKQKQNIGNYTSATEKTNVLIGNLNGRLGLLHPALGRVATGLQAGIGGFQGLTAGARAFIATGIGAIIAALGLAFAALMKYFQGSEEGQNRLNKIMAIGSAIFEQFLNVVEAVGEAVFDAINNPQQALKDFGQLVQDQVVNRFVGMLELIPNIGRAIGLLFEGKFKEAATVAGDAVGKVTLGVENATEKVTGFIERTNEAIQKGIDYGTRISAINAKIDREERKLIEDRAKTNLAVSKLRQQAVELEGDERIKAIKQAIALEEGLAQRETALAQTRLKLAELNVEANGNDKEALNELAEARARVTQAEATAYDNTLKFRKELEKLTEEQIEQEKALKRAQSGGEVDISKDPIITAELTRSKVILDNREQLAKDIEKINKKQAKSDQDLANQSLEIERMVAEQRLQTVFAAAEAIKAVTNEQSTAYKAAATAQALISTYTAATKAYEAAFLPVPTVASPALGIAFAAAAVAQGLANIAQINGIEFAEGGWTGPGEKWDVRGVVHADEYVVPKRVVNSTAGSYHVEALERMRLAPYADGGMVTRTISNPINQSLELANVLKNLGPFEVDVREVTRKQNRVRVKENISKI